MGSSAPVRNRFDPSELVLTRSPSPRRLGPESESNLRVAHTRQRLASPAEPTPGLDRRCPCPPGHLVSLFIINLVVHSKVVHSPPNPPCRDSHTRTHAHACLISYTHHPHPHYSHIRLTPRPVCVIARWPLPPSSRPRSNSQTPATSAPTHDTDVHQPPIPLSVCSATTSQLTPHSTSYLLLASYSASFFSLFLSLRSRPALALFTRRLRHRTTQPRSCRDSSTRLEPKETNAPWLLPNSPVPLHRSFPQGWPVF